MGTTASIQIYGEDKKILTDIHITSDGYDIPDFVNNFCDGKPVVNGFSSDDEFNGMGDLAARLIANLKTNRYSFQKNQSHTKPGGVYVNSPNTSYGEFEVKIRYGGENKPVLIESYSPKSGAFINLPVNKKKVSMKGAETWKENAILGWVVTHPNGLRTDSFRTKRGAEKYRDGLKQNRSLKTGLRIVHANEKDEPMALTILQQYEAESFAAENHCSICGEIGHKYPTCSFCPHCELKNCGYDRVANYCPEVARLQNERYAAESFSDMKAFDEFIDFFSGNEYTDDFLIRFNHKQYAPHVDSQGFDTGATEDDWWSIYPQHDTFPKVLNLSKPLDKGIKIIILDDLDKEYYEVEYNYHDGRIYIKEDGKFVITYEVALRMYGAESFAAEGGCVECYTAPCDNCGEQFCDAHDIGRDEDVICQDCYDEYYDAESHDFSQKSAESFEAFSIYGDDKGQIHIEKKCDGCGKEFLLTENPNLIGRNRAGAIVYENDGEISYPEYSPYGDLLCKSCWKIGEEEDFEAEHNQTRVYRNLGIGAALVAGLAYWFKK